ncbi:Gpi-Linked Nad(P)(+)--Arginine Adp-Ribosyltransferase 1 [Manis pentadactyla]|nr:Gpi-Linked Nad(P)(+)--Arginine Adp-Ribosyltransferase 1 [Manis pentadactyla]
MSAPSVGWRSPTIVLILCGSAKSALSKERYGSVLEHGSSRASPNRSSPSLCL